MSARTERLAALDRTSLGIDAGATRRGLAWKGIGLILFGARFALADPPKTDVLRSCPLPNAAQARLIADRLEGQGDYQRAGACYLLSGNYDRANRSFIQASRASAAAGARQFADGRDEAKAQWRRLQGILSHMR